jgi:hypothetical protein
MIETWLHLRDGHLWQSSPCPRGLKINLYWVYSCHSCSCAMTFPLEELVFNNALLLEVTNPSQKSQTVHFFMAHCSSFVRYSVVPPKHTNTRSLRFLNHLLDSCRDFRIFIRSASPFLPLFCIIAKPSGTNTVRGSFSQPVSSQSPLPSTTQRSTERCCKMFLAISPSNERSAPPPEKRYMPLPCVANLLSKKGIAAYRK